MSIFKRIGKITTWFKVTLLIRALRTSKLEHTTRRDFEDFKYTETNDKNLNTRVAAAYELGAIGDPRAVKPLIETFILSTKSSHLERLLFTTGEALEQIGTPAVEPLISLLTANLGTTVLRYLELDWDGRGLAAYVLGQIGDVRAVEPLIALLNNGSGCAWWWNVTVEALVKIGDARAINPLTAIARNYAKYGGERCRVAQQAVEKLSGKN